MKLIVASNNLPCVPLGRVFDAAASTSHRTATSFPGFSVTSAREVACLSVGVQFSGPDHQASVAQSVERQPSKLAVVGSIPTRCSILPPSSIPPTQSASSVPSNTKSRRVEPKQVSGVSMRSRPKATCHKKQSDPVNSVAAGVNPQLPRRTRTIAPLRKLIHACRRQSFTGTAVGGVNSPDRWAS